MNFDPYDKTPRENAVGKLGILLLLIAAITALGLALMGCSSYREHIVIRTGTVVTETTRTATVIGTGNRRDILGPSGISTTHSQIPESITAGGEAGGKLIGNAARSAAGLP